MSKHSKYVLERDDADFLSSHAGDTAKPAFMDFTIPDRMDLVSSARGADDTSNNARVANAAKIDRSADFLAGAVNGGGAPFTDLALTALAGQLTDGYWQSEGGNRRHFNVSAGDTLQVDISALTNAGKTLAKAALDAWTDASGLKFQFVNNGNADITFDDKGRNAFSDSVVFGNLIDSSIVNIGTKWIDHYGHGRHTYSMQTYVHEIGHALGLGHAGDYNGSAEYWRDAEFTNDSWQASVMSYFSQDDNTDVDAHFAFVMTPQMADIIAIRDLYGTTAIRAGDNVYSFRGDFEKYYSTLTVVDTGGTDTLDFSWADRKQTINLNAETFSSVDGVKGNLSISRGTAFEIAIGGRGDDKIIGNNAANALFGNGGKDKMTGGTGEDFFVFDTKASNKNVDTIMDFTVGVDTLVFNNSVFAKLKHEGVLTSEAFASNLSGKATEADDRLIYDMDSGNLFYDSNGSRHGGSVLVARLAIGLGLGDGDFLVI